VQYLLVVDECLIFWKKARIPTQDQYNTIKKLKKLYEDLRTLEKSKTILLTYIISNNYIIDLKI